MTVHVVTDVKLEIEATLDTPLVVSALTLASPGVATSTAHGLSNGDVVKFSVTDGTVELDQQVCRVANITVDTFELEGVDTSGMSAWVSGKATPVLTWSTLCQATNLSIGNAAPSELDGSNFCSKKSVTLYGLPGSTSGSIDIQHDAQLAAIQYLKAASTSDLIAFRYTRANGSIAIFGGITAFSGGFDAGLNAIETGSVPVTIPNEIAEYAS